MHIIIKNNLKKNQLELQYSLNNEKQIKNKKDKNLGIFIKYTF